MRVNRVSMRYFKYVGLVAAVAVFMIVVLSGCQQQPAQPPTVSVLSISDNSVLPGEEVTLVINADDFEKSQLKYQVMVGPWEVASGTIAPEQLGKPIEITFNAPKKSGNYSITVFVINEAGIKAKDNSMSLTVERPAPEILEAELDKTEATLPVGKKSVDVTLTFKASDTSGEVEYLNYTIEVNGADTESGTVANNEPKSVTLTIDKLGENKIKLIVSNGGPNTAEKEFVFKLNGSVYIINKDNKFVIGKANKSITFKVWYKMGPEDPTPSTMVWAIKDASEDVIEASGTVPYTSEYFNEYGEYNDFTIDSSTFTGLPAGEYRLCVKFLDSDGNLIGSAKKTYDKPIYYYQDAAMSLDYVSVPATNTDATDNVYDGTKGFDKIELKLDTSNSASELLLKGVKVKVDGFKWQEVPSFTIDGTSSKIGDFYYVELPATLVFSVDKLVDEATELSDATFVTELSLADDFSTEASYHLAKAIDSMPPRVNNFIVTMDTIRTARVNYVIDDANFKAATITFFIKDGEEFTPVATEPLEAGAKTKVVSMSKYFDKSELYYSWEVEDVVGNEVSTPVEDAHFQLDNGVGSVEVKWLTSGISSASTTYLNSTPVTLQIIAEDANGVAPGNISVEGPEGLEVATESNTTGNKVTMTLAISTDSTAQINASGLEIKVKDNVGNTVVMLMNGSEVATDTLYFPEATLVIDVSSPTIEASSFETNGNFSITVNEDYPDKVTIEASVNGSGFKEVYTGSKFAGRFTKADFTNAGLAAPDNDEVDLFITVYDKAGNYATGTTSATLDLVPPELEGTWPQTFEITRDSSLVKIHAAVKNSEGAKLDLFSISGGDYDQIDVVDCIGPDGNSLGKTSGVSGNSFVVDIDDATEATLVLTFKNDAVLDAALANMEVQINAYDNTYPSQKVATALIDYSDVMAKKDYITIDQILTSGATSGAIFSVDAATLTFDEILGVDASYDYYTDSYAFASDTSNASIVVEDGEATLTIGKVKFKMAWNDGTVWYPELANLQWTGLSAMKLDDYVPEVFNPDNVLSGNDVLSEIGGVYYWDLTRATQIVLTLPKIESIEWENSIDAPATFNIDAYVNGADTSSDFNTISDATSLKLVIDYDGKTFSSTEYKYLTKVATVAADVYNDVFEGGEVARSVLNVNAMPFMDEYALQKATLTDATLVAGAGANATLTINLEFEFNGVDPNDVSFINLGDVDATNTGDNSSFAISGLVDATIVGVDTVVATFTTDSTVTADTAATVNFVKDTIKFEFSKDGANFWVTNFNKAVSNE